MNPEPSGETLGADPVQVPPGILPSRDGAPSPESVQRLVAAFLAGQTPRTREAYRGDLADFRVFLKAADMDEAARLLLAGSHGEANALALDYRTDLAARQLAAATVKRRLAALRSLVKLARMLGIVSWRLEVPSPKVEKLRDTRGPGLDGVAKLLEAAARGRPEKRERDVALVRLLFDLALRRGEVAAIDLENLDLDGGRVSILGKGRAGLEPLTLPEETQGALRAWLAVRGAESGPLLQSRAPGREARRLSGNAIYKVIRRLGVLAKVRAHPHGLRHTSITQGLDLTNGNTRGVRSFARHADAATTELYDDKRRDAGGEVAKLVARSLVLKAGGS